MRFACSALLLTACALQYGDEPGPITGTTHRYVVDGIYLPKTNTEARQMADDLNGDRAPDNQLGMTISTLSSQGDVTTHGPDMIAAGAIASSLEIVANDLRDDETVSVVYHGVEGDDAIAVRGALTDGWFRSERTRTSLMTPGRAFVRLPVYVDADPTLLEVEHLQIDLHPDGAGGFDAYVRGGVSADAARHAAYLGAVQMIESNPHDHIIFMLLFDDNPHDWTLSEYEWNKNSLVTSMFAPDVTLGGEPMLSIGFRAHLSPCEGDCALPAPIDRCHDRVLDQDETAIDCGGATCGKCAANLACTRDADCLDGRCSNGMCQLPTCNDGLQNGFETEVDCGAECNGCAIGDACYDDNDCPGGSTCGPACSSSFCFPGLDECE
jgi:hypothetical protein